MPSKKAPGDLAAEETAQVPFNRSTLLSKYRLSNFLCIIYFRAAVSYFQVHRQGGGILHPKPLTRRQPDPDGSSNGVH